ASFFLEGQDPTDFPSVVATNPLDAYGLNEFATLSAYFGLATNLGDARGDFNTDGVVDLLDFDVLAANFESSPAGVVPEPATAGLLALAGLAAARRRRA
ncbi:MAG: PEP-CTERM sorting domain-containing protein, partial [Planctomycetota bacterium]